MPGLSRPAGPGREEPGLIAAPGLTAALCLRLLQRGDYL